MSKESLSRNAIARSSVYGVLARGFGYPTDEVFGAIASGEFYEDLIGLVGQVHPQCVATIEAVARHVRGTFDGRFELEAQYLATFETELPKPALSLYETTYTAGRPRAELLLELVAFYDLFGLRMHEGQRDFQDCIVAELEFMQFLTAKEAQAIEAGLDVTPYLLAERDFLARHLSPFVTAMHSAAEVAPSVFYRVLVQIAREFIAAEGLILVE